MLVDSRLSEKVLNEWAADQAHLHRGREKHPLPDRTRLAYLIDILFKASLTPEEGRFQEVSVSWLSPKDFQAKEVPKRRSSELALRFEEPKAFEAGMLAKLAAITKTDSCSLLVDWFEEHPKIWGVIYYRRGLHPLQNIPAGMEEGRHIAPDCPTFTVNAIGSIVITRGESVIARIERGDFRRATPTVFHSRAMGPILYKLFGWNVKQEGGRFLSEDDVTPLRSLEFLLSEIDPHAHGATVVFVPEASLEMVRQNTYFPWACVGDMELSRLFATRLAQQNALKANPRENMVMLVKAQEILAERVSNLARLARIDGALLLSPKFDLIGFGCRLNARKWEGEILEGASAFGGGGKSFDFSRLGTRHSSARDFVGAILGTVAFVASADGPIRGLSQTSPTQITCWPDCRDSMFA